jgi:hypothetical protein
VDAVRDREGEQCVYCMDPVGCTVDQFSCVQLWEFLCTLCTADQFGGEGMERGATAERRSILSTLCAFSD